MKYRVYNSIFIISFLSFVQPSLNAQNWYWGNCKANSEIQVLIEATTEKIARDYNCYWEYRRAKFDEYKVYFYSVKNEEVKFKFKCNWQVISCIPKYYSFKFSVSTTISGNNTIVVYEGREGESPCELEPGKKYNLGNIKNQ